MQVLGFYLHLKWISISGELIFLIIWLSYWTEKKSNQLSYP